MRLSELIEHLRTELALARKPDADARLSLEECELEIGVEVEEHGDGELELKVLGTGVKVGGSAAHAASHKVRVRFSPLPTMTFSEQLATLKSMIEMMNKEKVSPEMASTLIGQYFPKSPNYLNSTLPGRGLTDGAFGFNPKLGGKNE
ncbi:trypco2 family protein [Lysobacter panacisoli]|uniref:Trypsin-co-occurring domain-containing protein n=1 Tax=Lysobacter panacisoli TaxID=1255263 RepID=A0ABP9LEN4_9GAMM|nr:trypco2 family protein [Lysobacter panacisoli]